jgi:signal recognition particle subunit SRP54
LQQAASNVDESQFTRIEAIINGSRRKRIAAGSGTTVQEVNNLLRQHTQMSKLFKGMSGMASGGGMKAQQRLLSQMQGKQRFGR